MGCDSGPWFMDKYSELCFIRQESLAMKTRKKIYILKHHI